MERFDSIPEFHFRMIQLAERSFDALKGTPSGILLLRVMKAERLDQLLGEEVWDEFLLHQIPRETFEMLLRYILSADVDKKAFEIRVNSIRDLETRSKAMTLAQQYRMEGRQEGRQEGALKTSHQYIVETLEIRFGVVPEWVLKEVVAVEKEGRFVRCCGQRFRASRWKSLFSP